MNNPMEFLKMAKYAQKDPKKIVLEMISQNSNPMISNLIGLANSGKNNAVEQFARNMFKEKGRDFDKEFNEFIKQLK